MTEPSAASGNSSGPRLVRRTLSTLLFTVAMATGAAQALADARRIEGTADDMRPPRFFDCLDLKPRQVTNEKGEIQLEDYKLGDGRRVPYALSKQIENALIAMARRGKLDLTRRPHREDEFDDVPPVRKRKLLEEDPSRERKARKKLRFGTIVAVLMAIGSFDYGDGAYKTTEELIAARARVSDRAVRDVITWAKHHGWLLCYPRYRTTDRIATESGRPCTNYRSNVYVLNVLPLSLARDMTDEEILEYMALGEPPLHFGPRAPSTDAHAPSAPVDAPSAPVPVSRRAPKVAAPSTKGPVENPGAQAPKADAPAPTKPTPHDDAPPPAEPNKLPAHLHALDAELEVIATLTGVRKPVEWFVAMADKVVHEGQPMLDQEARLATLREAGETIRMEMGACQVDGSPNVWDEHRLRRFLGGCLKRKRKDILSGPGRMTARRAVAKREKQREREKEREIDETPSIADVLAEHGDDDGDETVADYVASLEGEHAGTHHVSHSALRPSRAEPATPPSSPGRPARTLAELPELERQLVSKLLNDLATGDLSAEQRAESQAVIDDILYATGPPAPE